MLHQKGNVHEDKCSNPVQGIKELFVDDYQRKNVVKDILAQDSARRAVFRKVHGIVSGKFEINENLDSAYKVGVFVPGKKYDATFRFSSDIAPTDHDFNSTVGIGIKLHGVDGNKELPEEVQSNTHDFILQNFHVFFVDNATEMCQFTRNPDDFLKHHPTTKQILAEMGSKSEGSVFTDYWSCVPYQFGDGKQAKYLIRPDHPSTAPTSRPSDAEYLRTDLKQQLSNKEVTLGFFVQLNDGSDPIDKATVPWKGTAHRVATLRLPKQDARQTAIENYGENLSFSPWRTLPAHKPLGSISEARKVVYKASADLRRSVNGVVIGEPFVPFCPVDIAYITKP